MNTNYDWLGICLDMLSVYLPAEVTTKDESKKYWEINPHLVCVLELSGLTRRSGTNERTDYLNDFLKDFIRIFNAQVAESASSEVDGENNFDNATLNNILLYSLVVNTQEAGASKQGGSGIENKLAKNLL